MRDEGPLKNTQKYYENLQPAVPKVPLAVCEPCEFDPTRHRHPVYFGRSPNKSRSSSEVALKLGLFGKRVDYCSALAESQ
jgi:hypothetical protein